jgi:hypothetical protein
MSDHLLTLSGPEVITRAPTALVYESSASLGHAFEPKEGEEWTLESVRATYIASATVGSRLLRLGFGRTGEGEGERVLVPMPTVIAAGEEWSLFWIPGASAYTITTAKTAVAGIPLGTQLLFGETLTVYANNFAGDSLISEVLYRRPGAPPPAGSKNRPFI